MDGLHPQTHNYGSACARPRVTVASRAISPTLPRAAITDSAVQPYFAHVGLFFNSDRIRQAVHISQSLDASAIIFHRVPFALVVTLPPSFIRR